MRSQRRRRRRLASAFDTTCQVASVRGREHRNSLGLLTLSSLRILPPSFLIWSSVFCFDSGEASFLNLITPACQLRRSQRASCFCKDSTPCSSHPPRNGRGSRRMSPWNGDHPVPTRWSSRMGNSHWLSPMLEVERSLSEEEEEERRRRGESLDSIHEEKSKCKM